MPWHLLLPPWVSVSAGRLRNEAPVLTVHERRSVALAGTLRLCEFAQGRRHAHIALARLGRLAIDVPVGIDRAPEWPPGIVGSLSHARAIKCVTREHLDGHVVAAVALARDCRAIGVDIDYVGNLAPESWKSVLTGQEWHSLGQLSSNLRAAHVQRLWCAKEAVIKAWRRIVEPDAIEISGDLEAGDFYGRWNISAGPPPAECRPIFGRVLCHEGVIVAAAVDPQPHPYLTPKC